MEKAQTDGILATFDAVKSKLDQPLALGYCNVGRVIQTNIDEYCVGDRVVSNGSHAEIVSVPKDLCAKIPDNVSDQTAAFTVLSAIGLQGIRLANPTLGEAFVVTGLGMIGLLTVQMLVHKVVEFSVWILMKNGCNWPDPLVLKLAICRR